MFKHVASAFTAAVLLSVASVALADPIVIKFAHVVTDDTPKGRGARLFQKLVGERMGDRVRVEVYPNSTLVGDAQEMAALQANEVQLLAPSLSKFDQYTKALELFDLPFLFDDLAAVQRFQKRDTGQRLLGCMAKDGIVGLAYWNNGMKQFSANRELRRPADAQGLAFRIQASKLIQSQFELLGAKAVPLPFSESFKALQSGQVQGTENTWSNLYSQKMNTVQPFMTESNHGVLSYMLITNAKFWNGLPFQVRSDLQAIADEVTVAVNKDAESINAKNRDLIKAAGTTTILALSPAERQQWRDVFAPLEKTYESEIGSGLIRAAQTVNGRL